MINVTDILNTVHCADCLDIMKQLPDKCIDLTVTSPPYDNLRTYNGSLNWSFKIFQDIAKELLRITKDGGVIVWVVADATIDGSETGTSFKQALYFKEIGFNLHDTMIWLKPGFSAVGALQSRYGPVFEYMFILSKNKIGIFNPLKDRKIKHENKKLTGTIRNKDGSTKRMSNEGKINCLNGYGIRYNVWEYCPEQNEHPAPFPVKLVNDHILSWSNPGQTIFDPFAGSGTTAIACLETGRNYICIEKEPSYVEIINNRIATWKEQGRMFA
jgi:DNA modification methylase